MATVTNDNDRCGYDFGHGITCAETREAHLYIEHDFVEPYLSRTHTCIDSNSTPTGLFCVACVEERESVICSDCGLSHAHQQTDYPAGIRLRATKPIPCHDNVISAGTLGTVHGHCNDGRAYVFFDGHQGSHTFHDPGDYLQVEPRSGQAETCYRCFLDGYEAGKAGKWIVNYAAGYATQDAPHSCRESSPQPAPNTGEWRAVKRAPNMIDIVDDEGVLASVARWRSGIAGTEAEADKIADQIITDHNTPKVLIQALREYAGSVRNRQTASSERDEWRVFTHYPKRILDQAGVVVAEAQSEELAERIVADHNRSDQTATGEAGEWWWKYSSDGKFHIRERDSNGDCIAHTATEREAMQIVSEHNTVAKLTAVLSIAREAIVALYGGDSLLELKAIREIDAVLAALRAGE